MPSSTLRLRRPPTRRVRLLPFPSFQSRLIASGGVGSLQHLAEGVLEGHADAVLAASIFHFGEFTVREAKEHMAKQGIEVRL